jgi:hypothetical protein
VDLRQHLLAIWHIRWLVLTVALLIGVVAYAVQAAGPAKYRADTTLSLQLPSSQGSDPRPQADYSAQTMVSLANTSVVQADAARTLGRGRTGLDVAQYTQVAVGTSSSLLIVSGLGSREDATAYSIALARALVDRVTAINTQRLQEDAAQLQQQIAQVTQQLASQGATPQSLATSPLVTALQAQYAALLQASSNRRVQDVTSLAFLAQPPAVALTRIGPKPATFALLAFLLGLVLCAEGTVFYWLWRGYLPRGDPARAAASLTGCDVLAVLSKGAGGQSAELVALWSTIARRSPQGALLILACGSAWVGDFVGESVRAGARLCGEAVTLIPMSGRTPAPELGAEVDPIVWTPDAATKHKPLLIGLNTDRLAEALMLLRQQWSGVLVAVDARRARRSTIRAAVEALRSVGAAPIGLVVVDCSKRAVDRVRPSQFLEVSLGRSDDHAAVGALGGR